MKLIFWFLFVIFCTVRYSFWRTGRGLCTTLWIAAGTLPVPYPKSVFLYALNLKDQTIDSPVASKFKKELRRRIWICIKVFYPQHWNTQAHKNSNHQCRGDRPHEAARARPSCGRESDNKHCPSRHSVSTLARRPTIFSGRSRKIDPDQRDLVGKSLRQALESLYEVGRFGSFFLRHWHYEGSTARHFHSSNHPGLCSQVL